MKRTIVFKIMLLVFLSALAVLACLARFSALYLGDADITVTEKYVITSDGNDGADNIPDSVDDLLDKLDLDGMQGLVDALDKNQLAVFGFGDVKERIRKIANGEYKSDFGSVVSYVLSLFGANVLEFMPMLLSVLAIVLAYNILNSVKGRFASESTERVVYFATGALALCLVVGYFSSVLALAVKLVASIKTQINTAAPVILTLMTATGASSSAGVYTPAVAALGSGMSNVVTYMAFPALLMGLVFDIIGSVSTSVKLDKTADFFRSACKWFMGTAFFLFVTVIGVSGITASVRDGVSVRAARFAVSKYVPVIGGYLSQGFDFIMAGNVLIKNAVGGTAVAVIALTVAPVIIKIAVFTLTLKLTAAIAEPLGGDKFSGALTSVSKSSSVIAAVVAAMTFLYILFLSMTICTGNIGL